jgi:hypothetical protein
MTMVTRGDRDRNTFLCHERQQAVNQPYTEHLAVGRVADTRLILKAVVQRWKIPEHLRQRLPEIMAQILEDGQLTRKERMTAAKILLQCEAQNQANDHASNLTQPATSQHLHIHGITTDERIRAAKAFLLGADASGAASSPEPERPGAGGIPGEDARGAGAHP